MLTSSITALLLTAILILSIGAFATPTPAAALKMTGQRYFANGTAIAYFDDGSTSKFEHEMTPEEGWYYDNTTVFYVGEIPGISSANNTKCSGGFSDFNKNSTITMIDNSTAQHTLTIINGADVIENKSKAIQPSPIIRIKAGDTVTWINEDRTTHILTAPPGDFSFFSKIPAGQTFEVTLSSTESTIEEDRRVSCTFTEPGGFHYDIDLSNNGIKGAVIVTEDNTTDTITPSEQAQQPSSPSPFSQQLQTQQPQQQEKAEDREEQLQPQRNQAGSVSIVPGASSLTDTAFQPNPLQVTVNAQVIWTNDDAQPHTVTSGENATPDGRFDSGIMAPRADFEHTFTEAGEYPYFCLLHPNMVGTVSVN